MGQARLEDLEHALGHQFRDRGLIQRALTHRSVIADRPAAAPSGDNEQLEYLGDAVLGMLVSEYLVRAFPEWTEGQLSKSRARLVNAASLCSAARRLGSGRVPAPGTRRRENRRPGEARAARRCLRGRDRGDLSGRRVGRGARLRLARAARSGHRQARGAASSSRTTSRRLQEIAAGPRPSARALRSGAGRRPRPSEDFLGRGQRRGRAERHRHAGRTRRKPSNRPRNRRSSNSAISQRKGNRPDVRSSAITSPEAHAARREHEKTSLREYIESLLVTIILALFGTTFVVQAFKIPSQSMEPTLLVGDHLLVNKFIFGGRDHWYESVLPYRDVRRGDVIVFKFPYQDHPHYVKRVIGVPGDRIKIVDQQVYRQRTKAHTSRSPITIPRRPTIRSSTISRRPAHDELLSSMQPEWATEIFNYIHDGEIVVPPDKYFAMGDNRDHSWDSRYWGFVDREAIMGRPVVIYWSVKADENDYAPSSFGGAILSLFNTLLHIPTDTRWNRMFHTVH